jgi:chromosome segregation ATPase
LLELGFSFALGALSVALLALAAVPALSRRAFRLASARARLLAPLDEKAAEAERDALRAGYVVEASRLERLAAQAGEREGRAWVEQGRESIRRVFLEKERDGLRDAVAALRIEADSAARELHAANADLGGAQVVLADFSTQRDAAQRKWADASRRMIAMEASAERDRAQHAVLQTRNQALQLQIDDFQARLARAALASARREEELAAVARSRDELAQKSTGLVEALDRRQREAERDAVKIAELSSALARARASHEEALIDGARRLGEIAERDAALRAAASRHLEQVSAGRAREQELAQISASDAAARAAADGALKVSRQAVVDLKSQIAQMSKGAPDDATLREAIARIGAQMETLAQAPAARRPRGGAAFRSQGASRPRRDEPRPNLAPVPYSEPILGPET